MPRAGTSDTVRMVANPEVSDVATRTAVLEHRAEATDRALDTLHRDPERRLRCSARSDGPAVRSPDCSTGPAVRSPECSTGPAAPLGDHDGRHHGLRHHRGQRGHSHSAPASPLTPLRRRATPRAPAGARCGGPAAGRRRHAHRTAPPGGERAAAEREVEVEVPAELVGEVDPHPEHGEHDAHREAADEAERRRRRRPRRPRCARSAGASCRRRAAAPARGAGRAPRRAAPRRARAPATSERQDLERAREAERAPHGVLVVGVELALRQHLEALVARRRRWRSRGAPRRRRAGRERHVEAVDGAVAATSGVQTSRVMTTLPRGDT